VSSDIIHLIMVVFMSCCFGSASQPGLPDWPFQVGWPKKFLFGLLLASCQVGCR